LKADGKYIAAVALLASLAVMFAVVGTGAPIESDSPQQESPLSSSVTHFVNPPTYDSGWVDIINRCGQHFNITHNLATTDVFVDITGKRTLLSGEHQNNLGGTGYTHEWSSTYGEGTGMLRTWGEAKAVVQTNDDGYAVAGTNYHGSMDADFWLIKSDPDGHMQWNKTYSLGTDDRAASMVQTSDGGYAIVGTVYDGVDRDFWLVKTNKNGLKIWAKTYDSVPGSSYNDYARSVVQTSDGGYAIAGYAMLPAPYSAETWFVKTDSSGNPEAPSRFSGMTGNDRAECVVQTSEGGYAIAGSTDTDAFLLKLQSNGATQWLRTYGEGGSSCVVQTSDGGYAMVGSTYSLGVGGDAWLIKTNSAGFMEWSENYGGPEFDKAVSVVQTEEGGYALAGLHMWGHAYTEDLLLVKTDSYGNMQWNRTYDWGLSDNGNSVIQTSDGGYAIAGQAYETWGAVLFKTGVESGLTWTDLTDYNITLYRGRTDPYWNFVRVRAWAVEEPTWQYGDINQDGVVDAQDLYILGRNYGRTLSALSLGGILAVAGMHTYKKRKQSR